MGYPTIPRWSRAEAEFALARSLWAVGDRDRALELAEAARASFRVGPPEMQDKANEADAWLLDVANAG